MYKIIFYITVNTWWWISSVIFADSIWYPLILLRTIPPCPMSYFGESSHFLDILPVLPPLTYFTKCGTQNYTSCSRWRLTWLAKLWHGLLMLMEKAPIYKAKKPLQLLPTLSASCTTLNTHSCNKTIKLWRTGCLLFHCTLMKKISGDTPMRRCNLFIPSYSNS